MLKFTMKRTLIVLEQDIVLFIPFHPFVFDVLYLRSILHFQSHLESGRQGSNYLIDLNF